MIPTFMNWLKRKKPVAPVKTVAGGAQPAAQPSAQPTSNLPTHHLSPEELDDLWQASGDPMGLSDRQRAAAAKNNPRSHISPDELDALWKSTEPK